MALPVSLRMVDLMVGDPSNAIVLKYLAWKCRDRSTGYACSGDILIWAQKVGIEVPGKRKITWLNYRVQDAINLSRSDPNAPFHLEEVEGWGHGINFRYERRSENE